MRINLDGSIVTALTRSFDSLVATLLFILCCLPVVTIGASCSAMYATMIRIAGDGCSSVTRCFFDAFKDNFKQATILWLLAILAGAVVAADIVVCWGFEMEATMVLSIMRGLTIFCTGLYLAMCIYIFAGMAVFHVTRKQAVTNALQWTVKKLPATLGLLLLWVAIGLAIYVLWYVAFPIVAFGLYWQAKLLRYVFELKEIKAHQDEEIDYS